MLDNNVRKNSTYRATGNTYLDFKLIDNLRFRTLLGVDLSLVNDLTYNDPRHGDGSSAGGTMNQAHSPFTRWIWQNILTYNKSINNAHNFDITLVAEYMKERSSFIQVSGSGLSDCFFNENVITGTWANQSIFGSVGENGLASYLGRFNYNFKDKYYVGGSLRADGLSKLSPENR